jgi:superfamily II DNA helicase RecQ
MLRYLECPFTGLIATLMVALEGVLRERLSIPNAEVFRRSTAQRTIQYRVMDSENKPASTTAIQFVQQLHLPSQKKGVIYVRDYATGRRISEALHCPFYKAKADDKAEVLEEWKRLRGWIVATGALGTGINIEGIIYVIHVDRPYGLTSFLQQSGRGGRNGEVSDSIIIVQVQNSYD